MRGPAGIRASNTHYVMQHLWLGPQSRTELAARTRLSRVTVSAIVDQLLDDRLVVATESGRSKVISLNSGEQTLILIDLSEAGLCRSSILSADGEVQCEADPIACDDVTDPQAVELILAQLDTMHCVTKPTRVVLIVRGVVDNDEWLLTNDHRSVREVPARLHAALGLPVQAILAHRAALMATLDFTAKSQLTLFSQNSEMGIGLAQDGFPFGDSDQTGDVSHLHYWDTKDTCAVCRRNGCLRQAWIEAYDPDDLDAAVRAGVEIMNAVVAPVILAFRPELVVVASTRASSGEYRLIERLVAETVNKQSWHLQWGPKPRFLIDGTPLDDLLRIGGASYARWRWLNEIADADGGGMIDFRYWCHTMELLG